jgi:hypothetical protein
VLVEAVARYLQIGIFTDVSGPSRYCRDEPLQGYRGCRARGLAYEPGGCEGDDKARSSKSQWCRGGAPPYPVQTGRGNSRDCRYWRSRRGLQRPVVSWTEWRPERDVGSYRIVREAVRSRPRRDWNRHRLHFRTSRCRVSQDGPQTEGASPIRGVLARRRIGRQVPPNFDALCALPLPFSRGSLARRSAGVTGFTGLSQQHAGAAATANSPLHHPIRDECVDGTSDRCQQPSAGRRAHHLIDAWCDGVRGRANRPSE